MSDEQSIKSQLQALLSKKSLDYSQILALSNELAKFDQNNVRFTVDADLISRLGNELVARQETALSELVKNSYDADATYVTIKFIDTESIGGTLILDDNGSGMNREQLIDGFMRISSNLKKEKPFSEIFQRKKAGKKGIGRFAVQRLGNKLEILTKTENATHSFDVQFDWNDYLANKDITEISNKIQLVNPHKEKGTRLIISNLKDKWSELAIKRIYRYLEDILQPVSEFNENEGKGPFELKVFKETDGNTLEIVNESLSLDTYAVATISGKVDDKGIACFQIESKDLDIDYHEPIGYEVDDKNTSFPLLKNVKLKANYFIENYLPKNQRMAIQKYLRLYGGIKLYRNGFRVLPYGEASNDWLKLDFSQRQRSLLPQHGNNNFYGVVNIDDSSGNFEETSSREGLLENESFIQLSNFVYRVLLTAVIRIARERNVKITSSQKRYDGKWQDIDIRVKNIAYSIDELDKAIDNNQRGSIEVKAKSKEIIKNLKDDLNALRKEQKEERKRQEEERTMLRVLSSVGLTTEQFVHEIKYYLGNMTNDLDYVKNVVYDNDAKKRVKILESNLANFNTYVSYFDAMVSNNVNRTLIPIEMRKIVRDFIEILSSDAKKAGVTIQEPVFYKYNLYTKPMHPSEWTSILFNFYTNSKKAIKRAHRKGDILIEVNKENGMIYLDFSDNGDGIPEGKEERVFDRFYTTSNVGSIDNIDKINNISGSGLGLTIVKDICTSNKGDVRVIDPPGSYSTCFRVEIPALSDKEIEKL